MTGFVLGAEIDAENYRAMAEEGEDGQAGSA